MSDDHFLDTNVIIGSRVTWDVQHNPASRYMADNNAQKHTCNKVCEEVKGYFKRTRAVLLAFLFKLEKEIAISGRSVSDNDIDKFAKDFKDQRKYTDDSRVWYPLNVLSSIKKTILNMQ